MTLLLVIIITTTTNIIIILLRYVEKYIHLRTTTICTVHLDRASIGFNNGFYSPRDTLDVLCAYMQSAKEDFSRYVSYCLRQKHYNCIILSYKDSPTLVMVHWLKVWVCSPCLVLSPTLDLLGLCVLRGYVCAQGNSLVG